MITLLLFNDLELHANYPGVETGNAFERGLRQIDDPPAHKRTSVIDPDKHTAARPDVGDSDSGSEGQSPVRRGVRGLTKPLAAGGFAGLMFRGIEGGLAVFGLTTQRGDALRRHARAGQQPEHGADDKDALGSYNFV